MITFYIICKILWKLITFPIKLMFWATDFNTNV